MSFPLFQRMSCLVWRILREGGGGEVAFSPIYTLTCVFGENYLHVISRADLI